MKRTTIILSLIFALAIALTVSIPTMAASDPASTVITATVPAAIDVTAPASYAWTLNAQPGTSTSATQAVTVSCNKKTWDLIATANQGGAMHSTLETHDLAVLTITGGILSGYQPLSSAQTLVSSGTTVGQNMAISPAITFQQLTTWSDPANNDYTITVTFTGTTH